MPEEVTIGSVWYVWGDHRRVVGQRDTGYGRQVRLERVNRVEKQKLEPWTFARLVAKWGVPSSAYAEAVA